MSPPKSTLYFLIIQLFSSFGPFMTTQASRAPSLRFRVWAFGLTLALLITLGLIKYWQIKAAIAGHQSFVPPPEAITTAVVKEESWQSQIRSVGSLVPATGVDLAAEEAGKVVAVGFESGQLVEQGHLLIALDTAFEEANLKAAEARAKLAQATLRRSLSLRKTDVLSEAEVDAAEAQLSQAEAEAASIRAIIARKRIVAPFAGVVGIRNVNVGDFVQPGQVLVPLHSYASLYLNVSIPQDMAPRVHIGQRATLQVDAFAEESFSGEISAVNPNLDPTTRSLRIQVLIKQGDGPLRAGMFGQVTIDLDEVERVIPVPASSIAYAPYGAAVFIVEKASASAETPPSSTSLQVRQQFVQLGTRRGDFVAVTSGLTSGQEVATSGIFKLRSGAAVTIDNSLAPSPSLRPNLPNT